MRPKKIGRLERNFITDRLFQLFLIANPVSTTICNLKPSLKSAIFHGSIGKSYSNLFRDDQQMKQYKIGNLRIFLTIVIGI